MKKHYPFILLAFVFVCFSTLIVKSQTMTSSTKILAIGNSFSEDAIENNLHDLAAEKGIKTIIGNLYIGGAPLHLHVANATENKPVYAYRKVNELGKKTTTPATSILQAIEDENWDYISLQQASPLSGQIETINSNLPQLIAYVKKHSKNPNVKIVYHQTWAYSQHAPHPGFKNYNNDQIQMYEAIVSASQKVKEMPEIAMIIPAGTAIQNARTSFIGDDFDRDGYHLRLSLGRYVAACTWLEQVFRISPVGLYYKPKDITIEEKQIAQLAAHEAVAHPYQITPLRIYEKSPKVSKKLKSAVWVGFGSTKHDSYWNPFTSYFAGKTIQLKDSISNRTPLNITITQAFNSSEGNQNNHFSNNYSLDTDLIKTAYVGNDKGVYKEKTPKQSSFKINGLHPKKSYSFTFVTAMKSQEKLGVQITSIGKNETMVVGDASHKHILLLKDQKPNKKGQIIIELKSSNDNSSELGLFYLNAMRISQN